MKAIRLLVFIIFLFILTGPIRLANAINNVDPKQVETAKSVQLDSILYPLPFPGILPNHPLYFFKVLRDTLIEKMITSDVKKAEFYILQADKRLQMSLELSGDENTSLREATRNEAFLYREKSLTTLGNAFEKNILVPRYVLEKLLVSTKKHEEVLQDGLIDTTPVTNLVPKVEALLNKEIDKK